MRRSQRFQLALILLASMELMTAACSPKKVRVAAAPQLPPGDNWYRDLVPGSELRVVLPLLKDGGAPGLAAVPLPAAGIQQQGDAILVSSEEIVGYQMVRYALTNQGAGGVRLKFVSAATTRNGKTLPASKPPKLPFELPRGTQHMRLVYLIRQSHADHNMAIIASTRLNALNGFTRRFLEDTKTCGRSGPVFCSWIPSGIGIRTEEN